MTPTTKTKDRCEFNSADCGKHLAFYDFRIYCSVHMPFRAFKKELTRPKSKKK